MRVTVTGSIATDHLVAFPGVFTRRLLADLPHGLALGSVLRTPAPRPGGTAANTAYGLARLGLRPVLLGAVGPDFDGTALGALGVDTGSVRVCAEPTARFLCATDTGGNRVAAFRPGAMRAARHLRLSAVADRLGSPGLVLIAADESVAMVRHAEACRLHGHPFAVAPSRQVGCLAGDELRALVGGARVLFTSRHEVALLLERTGWSHREVLRRVGTWVTTLGVDGVRLEVAGERPVTVPAVEVVAVDPTGSGDAFRAGYLAALGWGLDAVSAARLGCALAALAVGSLGAQGYNPDPVRLTALIADTHGVEACVPFGPHLGAPTVPLDPASRAVPPMSARGPGAAGVPIAS
ncbi:PfkB family carbohydrate kinase [Actinokineospora sp. PR83]|uniref:PfkB family carbohydrate kinase n=1 Tax=Actinokineospora sp. PR83 TaxID=2884908 RepID=UPI001F3EDDD7|nr:PfkB family carbohydrate kinase [Actinokineospora sp. PR83]MCG8915141.1 PfkB family carbohydrate kinase [Actinokineospora sp. PR83]